MTPFPSGSGFFTAQQIACALGRTKRAVQLALEEISPCETIPSELTRGQHAPAWQIERLPARIANDLRLLAQRKGYRDAAGLLNQPFARWTPRVPLAKQSAAEIQRATRLRAALQLSLLLQAQAGLTDHERVERGLADFRREYGNVSERHWRRMLRRTIERDAGEERFDDLAIYLSDIPQTLPKPKAPAATDSDRNVLDYLSRVKDPLNPATEELELVWTVICEEISGRVAAGMAAKAARRAVVALISQSGVAVAKNETALKKTLKRKMEAWEKGGMTMAALIDKRATHSGWHRAPELSEDERNKLIAHARFNCGGRVAQAYRDARERGLLGDQVSTHYLENPARKSYVPKRIMEAVAGDVKRLENFHHGPRAHRLGGAYHTREWSGVAAGDWFQADDLTPPVYYWRKNEHGAVELLRGQLLPMIDERTTYILGFVLISAANYNSLAIRSLITQVCSEHGLPRHGFYFERGIWKSSRILTGSRDAVPWDVADTGLRSLGLTFRHAQLPRGKVIERALGQLQNEMEGWPGYAGRDERNDCFERMQRQKLDVESGREPADNFFLSEEQITAEYFAVCERYNNTPQQGRKLDNMTPREGWESLQSSPRSRLDSRCLHLLAHDRRKVKVGRNGITIWVGSQRFNYKDEETGARVGEEVLAWFNPQTPDLLPCTDLSQGNVFTVRRSYELPAVGASEEEIEREQARIAAHNGYARELYRVVRNSLPASHYRLNAVDVKTQRVGADISTQRAAIGETRKREAARRDEVVKHARRAGVPASLVSPEGDPEGLAMIAEALRAKETAN